MSEQTFGNWLREKRTAAGFSQPELAKAAGDICTYQYISLLERGGEKGKSGKATQPDRALVIALAKAMKASVNDGLTLAGYASLDVSASFPATKEQEILEILSQLPVPRQNDIIAIARALQQQDEAEKESKDLSRKPLSPIVTEVSFNSLDNDQDLLHKHAANE